MLFSRSSRFAIPAFTLTACFSAPIFANPNQESIDIFAIPSNEIVNVVEHTSQTLNSYGMKSFYEQGKPTHITLYLTSFPKQAEEEIKSIIEKLATTHQAFPITANGATVTKDHWAFINVNDSAELQRLADEVTLAVAPLRDTSAAIPDWAKSYPNKEQAFIRYGSPNVFQNFEPHLTLLAQETNPKLSEFAEKLQQHPPYAQGKIVGIGIGVADQWGQQKKILAEYLFQSWYIPAQQ